MWLGEDGSFLPLVVSGARVVVWGGRLHGGEGGRGRRLFHERALACCSLPRSGGGVVVLHIPRECSHFNGLTCLMTKNFILLNDLHCTRV